MTPAGDMEHDWDGDDLHAAEYVLGVTPAEERQAASRRMANEANFARLVDEWEERLSPLSANYAEATPPVAVKQALDQRLFVGADEPAPRGSTLWQSLALWRGFAAASLGALLFYVAASFMWPPADAPSLRLVASLAADDSDVRYVAVYDEAQNRVGLSHLSGTRAPDRDFELWIIQGGNAPVSVGVVPVGETVHLTVPETLRRLVEQDAVFAISLEPEGGSPTGQPTGPVLAAGDLRKI